jgi:hypothetical protein
MSKFVVSLGHRVGAECRGTVMVTVEAASDSEIRAKSVSEMAGGAKCPFCDLPIVRIVKIQGESPTHSPI